MIFSWSSCNQTRVQVEVIVDFSKNVSWKTSLKHVEIIPEDRRNLVEDEGKDD